MLISEQERFDRKVEPVTESGCWIWTASVNHDGYGQFRRGNGKTCGAHKFSYEKHRGPIPPGMELDHLCRVRPCVNPYHLEPVSHKKNCLRGVGPTAVNAVKTACINGHLFTPDNTKPNSYPGTRDCRICIRRRNSEYKKRLRAISHG